MNKVEHVSQFVDRGEHLTPVVRIGKRVREHSASFSGNSIGIAETPQQGIISGVIEHQSLEATGAPMAAEEKGDFLNGTTLRRRYDLSNHGVKERVIAGERVDCDAMKLEIQP
jgi:hypothetical protein